MSIQKIPEFLSLLQACGMNKTDLALTLGIGRARIYQWKEDPPKYALAYLRLLKKQLATLERCATLERLVHELTERSK